MEIKRSRCQPEVSRITRTAGISRMTSTILKLPNWPPALEDSPWSLPVALFPSGMSLSAVLFQSGSPHRNPPKWD